MRNKVRMSTRHCYSTQFWKFQPQQSEKKKKRSTNWKRGKLSLFADDVLCIENPKYATRKLLEVNNEFGKVAGYKINAQKPHAFLYTNNERSERDIKETIPFTTATKRINYLGINLLKKAKDLYTETIRY